jgi:uncharacterized protein YeaO (DUF488 family)
VPTERHRTTKTRTHASTRREPRVAYARVYDDGGASGARILVDRLWPRGLAKADAHLDEWAKEVAPTTELRRWYGHDVARFDEFARRYRAELDERDEVDELVRRCASGPVVLLTATRDLEHSGARVLADYVRDRLRHHR